MVGKHFLGIVLNCFRDLENSICSMDRKGTPYEIVRKAAEGTLPTFKIPTTYILSYLQSLGSVVCSVVAIYILFVT